MSIVHCQRCSSERLYQFESDGPADVASHIPQVCRSCGAIHVEGKALELGAAARELEPHTKALANSAAAAGEDSLAELEKDPGKDISAYFARHYANAYLDGFLRAYAFYRHEAKEGRLKRLRELWRDTVLDPIDSTYRCTLVAMPPEVYAEIDQLLSIGDPNAASRENVDTTRK